MYDPLKLVEDSLEKLNDPEEVSAGLQTLRAFIVIGSILSLACGAAIVRLRFFNFSTEARGIDAAAAYLRRYVVGVAMGPPYRWPAVAFTNWR